MDLSGLKGIKKHMWYNPETGDFWWMLSGKRRDLTKPCGSLMPIGYRLLCFNNKRLLAHRVAFHLMGFDIPKEVDHINGVRDDNRWCNLRSVTRSQNQFNKKISSSSTTGYKGVTKTDNKWVANINYHGQTKYLGVFPCPELAHKAYCEAAKQYHGDFANFG